MSFIFDQVTKLIQTQSLNLVEDEISVVLINDFFQPDKSDKYLSEIPPANISSKPVILKNKSFENNVFDANDIFFESICGHLITGILIYQGCRDHRLIAFIDSAPRLPVTPNGGDIIVTWDNGTDKIFNSKPQEVCQ